MRNIAAHLDDDFEVREPAKKKAPRRAPSAASKRKKKGKGRFAFLMALDPHQIARYGAIGMSAMVAIGIMVNALALQKGHHPAPLFGKSIALGEPAPTPRPVAKKPETPPMPVEKPVLAKSDPRPEAEAPAAKSDDADAIGLLLQGKPVPADHTDAKTVTNAQKALTKLGFAVKATGTFGPQTKKAVESFEKARHLPVKGELSHRIIKVLAAESGLKIEH